VSDKVVGDDAVIVVWRAILKLWQARQRRLDVEHLWPQCVAGANTVDHAMLAFTVHCFNDPAWLALGEEEIRHQITVLGAQAAYSQERMAR
jgi:hypothetical protein